MQAVRQAGRQAGREGRREAFSFLEYILRLDFPLLLCISFTRSLHPPTYLPTYLNTHRRQRAQGVAALPYLPTLICFGSTSFLRLGILVYSPHRPGLCESSAWRESVSCLYCLSVCTVAIIATAIATATATAAVE